MIAPTASLASWPVALTMTSWPLVAPRAMTDSTLLASALAVPTVIWTGDVNLPAATASEPAGRACRSPVRMTPASELSGMPRPLGCLGYRLDVAPDSRGDRCGHRSLDERGVGEHDRLGKDSRLGQQGPDGEYRAAQVGQDQNAGAGGRGADGAADLRDARADAPIVPATSRDDDPVAAHPPGQLP